MSELKPKLSIILPVYNEADSLKVMVPILEAIVEEEHEVLVVYDSPDDNSIEVVDWLKEKYPNIRGILNNLGKGAGNAIKKGIQASTGGIILIALVDEVFPIAKISDMLELVRKGCDFVSCSRYARGGKRFGGSFIGGCLSRIANKLFQIITGSVLTDSTTAMKMVRKSIFEKITIEDEGWACAFEISIKAQLTGCKIGEVPLISVDRLFGGKSTFHLGPWFAAYMKWFIWGIRRLNRFSVPHRELITLDKLRNKEEEPER
ncbi:MAG: glycosyltransferase [Omnitrophica bacterium]|nr:glycosyltransferase [Candidatus Omnitrophota bacterium]